MVFCSPPTDSQPRANFAPPSVPGPSVTGASAAVSLASRRRSFCWKCSSSSFSVSVGGPPMARRSTSSCTLRRSAISCRFLSLRDRFRDPAAAPPPPPARRGTREFVCWKALRVLCTGQARIHLLLLNSQPADTAQCRW